MLNGNNLILRVRKNLRDVPNSFRKGEEWTDYDILLALNTSQLTLTNLCINFKYKHLLTGLIKSKDYDTTPPFTLPDDYLHYHAGTVKHGVDFFAARMMFCPFNYFSSDMDVIGIWDTNIVFKAGTNLNGKGVLYYYKIPTKIVAGNFVDCFSQMFYDMVCEHTTVFLGMKEIQSQREWKLNRDLMKNLVTQPACFANFNVDDEMGFNKKSAQLAQQKGQQ